ncbi:MAG: ATP-dependent DNA ligase [Sphingopyxis terrae]|uniref:ATP-dependent DNA ligase n=1 Tax=Sphingopyxis terrae TaxID=33052 RepID=UPI003F7D95BB
MTPFPRFPSSRPRELCQLAGRWRGDVPDGGIACEEKRDGWRALWFPGIDGKPRLWTRGGQAIDGVDHLEHRLSLMARAAGVPFMFDGEFQVGGTLEATKQWCERGWKSGGNAGSLYLFDAMPLADWERGRCDVPWIERKARLRAIAAAADADPLSWEWAPRSRGDTPGSVEILDDVWLFTADDVRDEANRIWARGGEGLMLKDPEAPYVRARSDSWLKVKKDGAA